jgi:hypothetical protein
LLKSSQNTLNRNTRTNQQFQKLLRATTGPTKHTIALQKDNNIIYIFLIIILNQVRHLEFISIQATCRYLIYEANEIIGLLVTYMSELPISLRYDDCLTQMQSFSVSSSGLYGEGFVFMNRSEQELFECGSVNICRMKTRSG